MLRASNTKRRILITSALPYANGALHFGHMAGAYLPADIYARFCRLQKHDVAFICGSDEYGIAITLSAQLANRTPQEQVNHFHAINKELFQLMQISFDHFSRTTCKGHDVLTQQFFLDLLERGYIVPQVTQQLYSEEEGRFLADRYVVGECPKCGFEEARGDECTQCGAHFDATELKNPRSKLQGNTLVLKESEQWFLDLPQFKDKLQAWLEKKDWSANILNFVAPYLEDIRARAITRDSSWGVPVPLEEAKDKVLYVWFDAPIGYISATQEWARIRGEPDAWEPYWLDEGTEYVQFIGKDNIVFHALLFPAMIMGQNTKYKQVDTLVASEFLNLEGKQFSKSSGWYIDLADFCHKFNVDALRYTLACNAPETQDTEFTYEDFQMRVNTELVGKFGNFVYRTLSFIHNRMDQRIPEPVGYDEIDASFLETVEQLTLACEKHYEAHQIRHVTKTFIELVQECNTYFDKKKPWVLLKEKTQAAELDTMTYCCLMAIKALSLITFPLMPATSALLWKQLGFTTSIENAHWSDVAQMALTPRTELPSPKPLFQKIEDEAIQAEEERLKSTLPSSSTVE